MVSALALDEKPIEHRRDVRLRLKVAVSVEPSGPESLEYSVKIPKTQSVKRFGSRNGRTVLDLQLEVRGATTGKELMFACRACSIRESSTSANLSIIDFVAEEDLIN